MDGLGTVLYIAVGTFFGAVIAWLLLRNRSSVLETKLSVTEREKVELTEKLNATQVRVEDHIRDLSEMKVKHKEAEEKLKLLDEAKEKLTDTFKALSSEALKSNNQSFLELAKENLDKYHEGAKGELEKRKQAIDELVKPINESLTKFNTNIKEIEKERVGAYESLTQQVKHLHGTSKELKSETSNLVTALRDPKARGQWGELQLERVVEFAGMKERCDFDVQVSTKDDADKTKMPDMIVKLPGNKNIIIDAKAPIKAYLEALEIEDTNAREEKLRDVSRQVRDQIKSLSQKKYWAMFEQTPEFVVMFLPFESLFRVALDHEKDLIEIGAKQKVILATPTTLIALLRIVAHGWREEKLAEHARQISQLGSDLYKRIATMSGHIVKLGDNIGKTADSYDDMIGSLERQVMPQARKFQDYGATPDDAEIDTLKQLDRAPRKLHIPEMTGAKAKKKKKQIIGE